MYIQIAGFNIKINFLPPRFEPSINDFKKKITSTFKYLQIQNPKKIDCTINFVDRKYNYIYQKKNKNFINLYEFNKVNNKIKTFYWISLFEFKIILQDILFFLLRKRGFFLHASANYFNNGCYIFLGGNGAGKSTIINLLSPEFIKIADDNVILRKIGKTFYLYQTPFLEKNNIIKTSKRYKINHFFFIKKSHNFKIEKIKQKKTIISLLTKQIISTNNSKKEIMKLIIELISILQQFSYLYFNKNKNKLKEFIKEYGQSSNK